MVCVDLGGGFNSSGVPTSEEAPELIPRRMRKHTTTTIDTAKRNTGH